VITKFSDTRYDFARLAGGLDQITPTLALKPGIARRAANFECSITGGYTRIQGYERFDGRARPSAANYVAVVVASASGFVVGQSVTTATGSGVLVAISDATLVLTKVTGSFNPGQAIGGTAVISFALIVASPSDDARYRHLAANEYRKDIGAVPGAGPVLGVAYYGGKVYAWRNNAAGTDAVMWFSSATGWQPVTFFEEVKFTNANTSVIEGQTLTQGGVSGLIRRVVLEKGSLASSTNSGRLIISGRTGGSFSAAAATSSGGGLLTLGGSESQIRLLPGGRFNSAVANFGGGPQNRRLYVADGVNRAFEFDGDVLVPISTGMTPDRPARVMVHRQHLFLSFGYSLQYSAVGFPYSFSPILGAGEIAMNTDITDLVQLPGDQATGALAVFTTDETAILYGSSAQNFQLSNFNTRTGAVVGTAQNLEQTYILTDQGVVSLSVTQQFGNFLPASLTTTLRPFIRQHLSLASCSGLSREKAQYRVFFSDGFGLYVTVRNGQFLGAMPVQFPDPVICMTEGDRADGSKTSYFGSNNGYVYEIDAGTSFDGQDIPANVSLVFNAMGNSRLLKRYRKASFEIFGDAYAKFAVGYDLGYRSMEYEQAADAPNETDLRSSYWDQFTWDDFLWDGKELAPAEFDVTGSAENVAFRISCVAPDVEPFTVNSITVHYSPRRGIR
jgi:hypothetical protein